MSPKPFKRDFKEIVKTLGTSAQFTPFYVVYNGASYGCTGVRGSVFMATATMPRLYVRGQSVAFSPLTTALPLWGQHIRVRFRFVQCSSKRGILVILTVIIIFIIVITIIIIISISSGSIMSGSSSSSSIFNMISMVAAVFPSAASITSSSGRIALQ